jgi:WD40 repeat protein
MLAASSQFRHQVWLWKMEDGKLLATLEQSGPFFDWSPDSKKLAVAYYNFDLKTPNECGSASNLPSGVRVWSVETNQSLNLLCGYDSPLFGVRWSWDGKTIATSSEDATSTNNVKTQGIVRLSSPAGQEKTRLYVKASFITNLAWSPDGKTLAVTARNGCYDCIVYENGSDGGIVELWNSEGQKLGTVADTSYLLAWSSDGKMLAVASYLRQETSSNGAGSGGGLNSRLIQLVSSDGQLLKTLSGHSQSLTKLAWSPDGKRLASASLDKTVQLWK